MEKISFEELPSVISEIRERLINIEVMIKDLNITSVNEDSLLSITEAAVLLNLATSTIYGKVCRREIPVCKKGKRLYFERDVLLEWVRDGKKKTSEEMKSAADDFFKKQKRFK